MRRLCSYAVILLSAWVAALTCARAVDPGFQKWLQDLWPQAQALGVSRATFDAATRALEPDLTLPDLDLPGREGAPPSTRARSPRSSSNSGCPETSCLRFGAARPRSVATSCLRTPSRCSPRRAITGGAR